MVICEFNNYAISSPAGVLNLSQMVISRGDVCCIRSDSQDAAHFFLRGLATLAAPDKGTYCFHGKQLDFSDYRNLLSTKRKIGYITPETAMLSNRTIRQNLLFMRYYFENSRSTRLTDDALALCRMFGLVEKLDQRPAALDPIDIKAAIIIRELMKSPELMILERPEIFVGQKKYRLFVEVMQEMLQKRIPVVFFSDDRSFLQPFQNRQILINGSMITAEDV